MANPHPAVRILRIRAAIDADLQRGRITQAVAAALRDIVALHGPVGDGPRWYCRSCHDGWGVELDSAYFPCPTLTALAGMPTSP